MSVTEINSKLIDKYSHGWCRHRTTNENLKIIKSEVEIIDGRPQVMVTCELEGKAVVYSVGELKKGDEND